MIRLTMVDRFHCRLERFISIIFLCLRSLISPTLFKQGDQNSQDKYFNRDYCFTFFTQGILS